MLWKFIRSHGLVLVLLLILLYPSAVLPVQENKGADITLVLSVLQLQSVLWGGFGFRVLSKFTNMSPREKLSRQIKWLELQHIQWQVSMIHKRKFVIEDWWSIPLVMAAFPISGLPGFSDLRMSWPKPLVKMKPKSSAEKPLRRVAPTVPFPNPVIVPGLNLNDETQWGFEWDDFTEFDMYCSSEGLTCWHPWIYYNDDQVTTLFESLDPLSLFHLLKDPLLLPLGDGALHESLHYSVNVLSVSEVGRLVPALDGPIEDMLRRSTVYTSALSKFPLVFDSGASLSLTPVKGDFIGPIHPCAHPGLQQLTSTVDVMGIGTAQWTVNDVFGTTTVIETTTLYVPQAEIRLLSPQAWFKEMQDGSLLIDSKGFTLTPPSCPTMPMHWPYDARTNLPSVFVAASSKDSFAWSSLPSDEFIIHQMSDAAAFLTLLDQENANLGAAAKELLGWHWKLGHLGLRTIRALFKMHKGRPPILKTKHKVTEEIAIKCASCQVANAKRRSSGATTTTARPSKTNSLSAEDLKPGQAVSLDQYESSTLGRRSTTFGKESDAQRYRGGTIFCDHASGLIFIHHQVSLAAEDTLRGKVAFERFADEHGVSNIQQYHADNGIFQAQAFKDDCLKKEQAIDFSGVGAHHQNGVAESDLGKVVRTARVMMIHAALHWPETAQDMPSLWAFAMDHSVYLWNNTPHFSTGLSPLEKFAGTSMDHSHLRHLHVWGCPTFVLDPRLQDGKRVPKWTRRARQGQNLGYSSAHGSSIALIRNLETGSVSPQFHCVFDDWFHTVYSFPKDEPIPANAWSDLCLSGLEYYLDKDIPPEQIPPLGTDWEEEDAYDQLEEARQHHWAYKKAREQGVSQLNQQRERSFHQTESLLPFDDAVVDPKTMPDDDWDTDDDTMADDISVDSLDTTVQTANTSPPKTRSGRTHKAPVRLIEEIQAHHFDTQKVRFGTFNWAFLSRIPWPKPRSFSAFPSVNAFTALMDKMTDPDTDEVDVLDPRALAAQIGAADTFKYKEAMNSEYKEKWWQAALDELRVLKDMKVWDVVDRTPGMNVLKSTWVFRIKRFPSGLIKKFKARFCACGYSQIEGVDVFDTFAPVAKWTTVRLLLMLALELNLTTVQADIELAFPHADVDEEIYVEMPQGFTLPGKVLKLKKTLYGIKQGPRNFFNYLKAQLEANEFVQSQHDPCLFIHPKVLCLSYVDDTIFVAKDAADIEAILEKLRKDGTRIAKESTMAGYLGVDIHRLDDGSLEFLQTGLIKRIISSLHLQNSGYAKKTPAAFGALPKDEGGEPAEGKFSYASVVGMLLYLCGHSRPELQFAVSQCARFVHNPTRLHEEALVRIGLYLKGTSDKGLIVRSKGNLRVEMFCDADFAGLWGYENPTDPACVKSRAGWIVWLGGFPVIWGSKLINQLALSTMEAEYYAMSLSMRELIPFLDILKEVGAALGVPEEDRNWQVLVHEDNSACLTLANLELPRTTPRSKHFANHYHWFRAKLDEYNITLVACDTGKMLADILTKGLRSTAFVKLRKLVCGW